MIYIKTNGKEVVLGGTIATEEMIANGWVEYNGEIPVIEDSGKYSKIVFIDNSLVLDIDEETKQSDLAQETKVTKQLALDSIVVEVNGHIFDAREKDQARIMTALKASEILNITTVGWKLANNTTINVDVGILEMVLALGIQEVGRIVKGE